MADLHTMYRVMILYMLNQVEYPLTNTQITNFILEKEYTNYFTVQEILSDLISSQLITAESTHNNTRYRITPYGQETLGFFHVKISDAIKEDIRWLGYTWDDRFFYASDYFDQTYAFAGNFCLCRLL